MEVGYVRVSSDKQNEARQIEAMKLEGVEERNIYIDKASGKNFERDNWRLMLKVLREGDCLLVESIDRLGRNYQEILEEWRGLVKRGIDIVVLDMPLLDTRNKKDLTGVLISDIVLQLLSYVAEKEREAIRSRQAEGIAIAKKLGKYKGRKEKEIDKEKFELVYERAKRKEITQSRAMAILGLKRGLYYKLIKEYEGKVARFA